MRGLERSLLIIAMSLLATACGRKGPLLYPDMLVPAAPAAVTARQSGSVVKLYLDLPDKDRAGRAMDGVAGVKISRKAAETGQKDVCRSCMTDYKPFQTIYLAHLPTTTQRFGNRLMVIDSDVTAGNSYSYSIAPFTADGVDGASSQAVEARVAAPVPAPLLEIESLPTELRLHILVHPLVAARMLGYNLYRSSGVSARSYLPINNAPLKGNEYIDGAVERGVKYRYSARTLIVRPSGDVAESAESNEVEGILKDDE